VKKQRIIAVLILIVITLLGFFTKFYSGIAEDWVNDSVGGLLYEIFWCLVIYLFFPKAKIFNIALWVFILTCSLEFLQLWHPPFLERLRGHFIGRTILGNSFNWMDFPYYLAGSFLGYIILLGIQKVSNNSKPFTNT